MSKIKSLASIKEIVTRLEGSLGARSSNNLPINQGAIHWLLNS